MAKYNLKIVYKNFSDLKPYENNPVIHNPFQIEKLAAAIKKFGFKVPMLITVDGLIIAGHGRMLGAIHNGMKKGPCIIADDLSEDEVKAFRIADNQLQNLSTWDNERLKVELGELEEIDFDIELIGFDKIDIENIDNDCGLDGKEGNKELGDGKEKKDDEALNLNTGAPEPQNFKKNLHCPQCGFEFGTN